MRASRESMTTRHAQPMRALALLCAALCTACAARGPARMDDSVDAAPVTVESASDAPTSVTPMSVTVDTRLLPQVDALLQRLMREERALTIDGQPVFAGRDKFLPGKIAVGMAHVIERMPADDPRLPRYLEGFRRLTDLTVDDDNREWGMFYSLTALHMLDQAGLLQRAVAPDTLARLRERLDWRSFVREDDLAMIGLPNNYYGVAYGIAELRHALGWDDRTGAVRLLEKTLAHYRQYSATGFADETEGDGRYDRYSVLLVAEIAHRFIEAGREPPEEMKRWLHASAQLMLLRVGPNGEGFEYGRSIGAYGETAVVEVLTAAAYLDVLTPEEREVAYAACARIAQRYMDLWVDARTGSVNLWDGGRRTDAYRGKHRILGENLSLARQFFYTSDLWTRMGYAGKAPQADLAAWRASRPRATFTRFNTGEPQRGLFTVIDGQRLFGLPFINGGKGQHMHSPYFALPFSEGLIAGIADGDHPQLLPRVRLTDGAVLQPGAFHTDLRGAWEDGRYVVRAALPQADRLGAEEPVPDPRLQGETTYVFAPGRVSRSDALQLRAGGGEAQVEMVFAAHEPVRALRREGTAWVAEYGAAPGPGDAGAARAGGPLRQMRVEGYTRCDAAPAPADHAAPAAPFRSVLRCSAMVPATGDLRLGWRMDYARAGHGAE